MRVCLTVQMMSVTMLPVKVAGMSRIGCGLAGWERACLELFCIMLATSLTPHCCYIWVGCCIAALLNGCIAWSNIGFSSTIWAMWLKQ
jgi:hypothetical protein